MLPNTGESCPEAQSMGVNALVLSGGDDIGATPLRDASEIVLLRWTASCRCSASAGDCKCSNITSVAASTAWILSGMSAPGTLLAGWIERKKWNAARSIPTTN